MKLTDKQWIILLKSIMIHARYGKSMETWKEDETDLTGAEAVVDRLTEKALNLQKAGESMDITFEEIDMLFQQLVAEEASTEYDESDKELAERESNSDYLH
jgi:hypothetical protein